MDWNENDGFEGFLQELIDGNHLEGSALGITKKVIDEGIESLSDKQKDVFEKEVMEIYVHDKCEGVFCGGVSIPWSEMYMAIYTGGICGYCTHKSEKIEKE